MRRYEAWDRDISTEIKPYFADLIRAFTNRQPFILNHFNHPVTNAYTESLNSLIRVMNRLGHVDSFEALRVKINSVHRRHPQPQAEATTVRAQARGGAGRMGYGRRTE